MPQQKANCFPIIISLEHIGHKKIEKISTVLSGDEGGERLRALLYLEKSQLINTETQKKKYSKRNTEIEVQKYFFFTVQ